MKTRFLHLLSLLLVGSTLVMTSCTKDDDMDPEQIAPVVGFNTEAGFVAEDITIEQGSVFKARVIAAKGSGNLTEFSVLEDNAPFDVARLLINGNAAVANPVILGTAEAAGLDWTFDLTAADHEAIHVYRFQVKDANGKTGEVSFKVTTFDPGTPVTALMGVLLNQAGPAGTGGLDLDTGAGTGSNDAAAEIRDMGIDIGQAPATNWRQQIAPANNAVLRKAAAGTDFSTVATREQIATLFAASGANLAMTNKVQPGELYVIERNGNHYLIRIAEVNITTDNNADNYVIDIKK